MTADDETAFETSYLEIDLDLPDSADELTFPDIYVGLEINVLAPSYGIVTDRHHASADRYEADDPQNQIAPFTLSGWLRHGCGRVLQTAGTTACHPGNADGDYILADVYERDLDHGYHEKDSCTDTTDADCVIYDLFGGFNDRADRIIRRPIRFSPIRRQVAKGETEAHYRQLNTHVHSRNAESEGQPLRQATHDIVGNLEGTWRLTLRELNLNTLATSSRRSTTCTHTTTRSAGATPEPGTRRRKKTSSGTTSTATSSCAPSRPESPPEVTAMRDNDWNSPDHPEQSRTRGEPDE